jgi:hypothetical protein
MLTELIAYSHPQPNTVLSHSQTMMASALDQTNSRFDIAPVLLKGSGITI